MDLNQVRYFLNLAESLNFTEAARVSGISQSPTRKELSGFSWLWFCPVARLNGATHALD